MVDVWHLVAFLGGLALGLGVGAWLLDRVAKRLRKVVEALERAKPKTEEAEGR